MAAWSSRLRRLVAAGARGVHLAGEVVRRDAGNSSAKADDERALAFYGLDTTRRFPSMPLYAILLACSSAHGLNLGAARSAQLRANIAACAPGAGRRAALHFNPDAEATGARACGRCLAAKEASGLSYDDLASELGLTNTYTAQLLLGQAQLKPATAEKLQKLLKLTAKDVKAMR